MPCRETEVFTYVCMKEVGKFHQQSCCDCEIFGCWLLRRVCEFVSFFSERCDTHEQKNSAPPSPILLIIVVQSTQFTTPTTTQQRSCWITHPNNRKKKTIEKNPPKRKKSTIFIIQKKPCPCSPHHLYNRQHQLRHLLPIGVRRKKLRRGKYPSRYGLY